MANKQFNIYVEGTDDHDLVLVIVKQLRATVPNPNIKITREGQIVTTYLIVEDTADTILISSIGGWANLGKKQSVSIQQARDSGGKTLIVFDADEAPAQRAAILKEQIATDEPAPALFLFPSPNQPGELEDLLLQVVQPAHQAIMTCYDGYEQCLQQLVNNGQDYYNTPSKKRRIYDYVNVMPLEGAEWDRHHKKGGQKIFENPSLWNLNAPAIQPLRDFLNQHLS
ncbi:DUF3226 domain-containing protein [Hymenobacter psychrophilus]|uniref:DUF4276 family protein n=1 Tax=Hymenobacter psychrophilus TaxID=651662 RepID=A0A1H3JK78_9BACT|nr:DUF3226 domain-containing protein [Hymenobacter psychrophilus]SDY40311.1 hypothetical protein SAMN04488069_108118 [Hymenobacter psychrophilus]